MSAQSVRAHFSPTLPKLTADVACMDRADRRIRAQSRTTVGGWRTTTKRGFVGVVWRTVNTQGNTVAPFCEYTIHASVDAQHTSIIAGRVRVRLTIVGNDTRGDGRRVTLHTCMQEHARAHAHA
jgi:hypothetical protein